MSIDDRARMLLHQRLEHVLGADEADTLMAHLPPSGWGDVATKGDLDLTRSATRADVERAGAELRLEIGDLRTEMRTEIGDLRTEMRTGFADLRTEMHRSQRTLAFACIGVAATMNSVVAALVVAVR